MVIRVVITIAVAVLAAVLLQRLVVRYQREPWTRDGRVRADVVRVTSDESGLVESVDVVENQRVASGQVLFSIDRRRYELALEQTQAALDQLVISGRQARRDAARDRTLGTLVSPEQRETGEDRVQANEVSIRQARSNLALAQLNLARTNVVASVPGIVVNVTLRPGDYATVGQPRMALIDVGTLHVDGYFEETKLPNIRVGAPASVQLMGESRRLAGHVQSVGAGIADRERDSSADLLPNINPTFDWVRLAQRVPVRIVLDRTPEDARLIIGRTATVSVQ